MAISSLAPVYTERRVWCTHGSMSRDPSDPEHCPLDCLRSDGTPHPECPIHGRPPEPETPTHLGSRSPRPLVETSKSLRAPHPGSLRRVSFARRRRPSRSPPCHMVAVARGAGRSAPPGHSLDDETGADRARSRVSRRETRERARWTRRLPVGSGPRPMALPRLGQKKAKLRRPRRHIHSSRACYLYAR